MSLFYLIDFFDQEVEPTNELKTQLEHLRDSIWLIQVTEGPFVMFTRALELINRILNLISVTESMRDSN